MLLLAALASAATYRLDPAEGALYVLVTREPGTLASGLAHDHVVAASGWSGRVEWGDGACAVTVEVPVASLVVDDPAWRARAGLEKTVSERQRAQVRASMLAEGQLYAEAHPTIRFAADRCDAARVDGDLTLRGVTTRVSVPLTVTADAGRIHATGRFPIRATQFGFAPYSAFLGAVKNRDEMTVVVDVVGVAAP
jgi:polyisoprenoid-binding protein YceI